MPIENALAQPATLTQMKNTSPHLPSFSMTKLEHSDSSNPASTYDDSARHSDHLADYAVAQRSLPSFAPPVSTLDRIPGARRVDPSTLQQDRFLALFNPRLWAFRLSIVQQPIRARMCGSSDKDWRPVSPPPVLKLELYDSEGYPVIESSFMQFLVIHTTLWKEDCEEELTVVELPHNASSKRISAAAKSRKRGVTQFGSSRAAEPGLEMENNLLGDYAASSSIVDDED
ncbi:hypothetical protein GGI07_005840, partial [Coemansia sp. Benny D115]